MKTIKKILPIFLVLLLISALFACGGSNDDPPEICTECVDSDGDEKCDNCQKDVAKKPEKEIVLFENGEPKFQFVLAKDLNTSVRETVNLNIKSVLKNKYKISLDVVAEGGYGDVEKEVEVLVGDVTNRGEKYTYDKHTLGLNGYVIKIIDSKIIINAGSDEQLSKAITKFARNIIGLGNDEILDAKMTSNDVEEVVQTDYSITSLKIGDKEIKGYTIATDLSSEIYTEAANSLRYSIYEKSGYWLEIEDIANATDNSIYIIHKNDAIPEESFKVYTDGTKLMIECSIDAELMNSLTLFSTRFITIASGEVSFEGNIYQKDISFVTYEQFGAKGDGVTDDFRAIYNTHEHANKTGQTVKANPNATYYIFDNRIAGAKRSAKIKTNVDWQGAHFIIDDRLLSADPDSPYFYSKFSVDIFIAQPNDEHAMIKISDEATLTRLETEGINRTTTNIDLKIDGWDGDIMIIPYNSEHKLFRRIGYNGFAGGTMNEVIIIDKDGNVSPETPITYEFTNIDYINVCKLVPDTPITIENGIFTTRASQSNIIMIDENGKATAEEIGISRGLQVCRSYTTVRNVEHYVTDEIPLSSQVDEDGNVICCGFRYTGFFTASNTSYVLFEDCTMTARRCYLRPQGGIAGTYDLHGNRVNKLVYKNCHQTNFWVTVDEENVIHPSTADDPDALTSMSHASVNGTSLKMYWGIGASNYCKNMEYIDSTLSRFDAHCGLYNGKIENCTINYIELTGNGTFVIDNVTWYSASANTGANAVVPLRGDYGYTWEGDLVIKDVKAYVYTSGGSSYTGVYLLYHQYSNWYFGYTTAFPSLDIDNLDFYDIKTRAPLPEGFEIKLSTSVTSLTKMHLPESHTEQKYAVIDNNGDGFIDEPLYDKDLDGWIDPPCDLDGNGVVGETYAIYEHVLEELGEDYKKGISLDGPRWNFNQVIPPKYIKIINNDGVNGSGGYVYVINSTAGQNISDGGHWDEIETYGGFLGDTKFIYGEDEEDYVIGSSKQNNGKIKNFKFV